MSENPRPFDMLEDNLGAKIRVERKWDLDAVEGQLISFDKHLNLHLRDEDGEDSLLRGDTILTIEEAE